MILGLEDIPGGTPIAAFLIWLVLSGLFYLVCFLAVLNVLDDLTRNSLLKIPAMLGATIPAAGLMAVFHYKPFVLGTLILIMNFYRVRKTLQQPPEKWGDLKLNPALFYFSSYAYIFLLVALAIYFPTLDFSQ
ncbi:MAG: hypothetical protein HOF21_11085 [Nitrospina sp.]|jgi:hypothetical protein|nr:hypothetical protein [Nitrospina sp.]